MRTRERLDAMKQTLWNERSSFDQQWRDVAQFLFPTRPRWTLGDKKRGDRRNQSIINSTATFALQTLRSGMHAGLTSPARPWMKLSTPDPSLTSRPDVAAWLTEVTKRMHAVFHLSNIYNALPMLYGDVACFGTGACAIVEDPGTATTPGDLFRAQVFPVGSFAISLDARGLAGAFVNETSKTVEQIIEQYGGKDGAPYRWGDPIDWSHISKTVKNLFEKNQIFATVPVYWAVYRNREYRERALGPDANPWKSCHWEQGADNDHLLRESGFREFPIMAPRWIPTPDEAYANEYPGITALGDVKQLQMMERKKGQAIEKMVNPALVGPVALQQQKVSILPGAITYVDVREGMQTLRPVHEVKPDLSHFMLDAQRVEDRINRAFYVDLFLMLTMQPRGSTPPTAREIDERHEEKMLVLGPVLESMIDELLDPLVDRVFAMMARAGLIPDPPEALLGVSLTVEYVSILAQAMKMQQSALQDRFLQSTLPLAQIFPEVSVAMNPRKILREYQESLGIDPGVLHTDEEIDAQLAAQQQQAAQAQQLAASMAAAKTAKDLGNTPMDTNSALDKLAGAGGDVGA